MIKQVEMFQGLNVTYNITEDCNLKCAYCYEVDKKPVDLPLDYAKRFNRILLDDPNPIGATDEQDWIIHSGIILDFIGGDALMRPKLVEQIIRDFIFQAGSAGHRWARRWRSSISTNGTLFGEPGVKEFLNEFKENISLGVSVDGCPEIHNKNRSNSMSAILKHWDWYMNYTPNPSTKATLNRDSIPFLLKSLKFLHEDLGLKYINMNFIFEDMELSTLDLEELDKQMVACVEYVKKHDNDIYWSMLSPLFGDACSMKDPEKGWCGAGSMPCLSVNGKIYPCFRFMPHTMHDRAFDLPVGDVWNGFDKKENFLLVRQQTRDKISNKECLECPIETCCSWCIGSSFSETGKFHRQTNICEVHKIQAKHAKEYQDGGNT